MTVALTGATGALGRLVVDALLSRGTPASDIVAVVRDAAKAQPLADLGVTVRVAAYGDAPALSAALAGVDRLLLVSGSEPGNRVDLHASVVTAAKGAGVSFIAYTSAPHADATTLFLAPDHAQTEAIIRESGLTYCFLRNNWYSENYLGQLATADATGLLLSSAGTGRVASASRVDYAEGAAAVLTGDGRHDHRVYELSGDVAWSSGDLAATLADVLGKPVALVALDSAAHAAALKNAGLDDATIWFATTMDANIAAGTLADATHELADLIGRPTTPLAEGLRAAR